MRPPPSLSLPCSIWTIAREISLSERQTESAFLLLLRRLRRPLFLTDDESKLKAKEGRFEFSALFPLLPSFLRSPKRQTDADLLYPVVQGDECRSALPLPYPPFRSSLTRQSSDDLFYLSCPFPSSLSFLSPSPIPSFTHPLKFFALTTLARALALRRPRPRRGIRLSAMRYLSPAHLR